MSNQPLQYESPRASGWTKHEVAVLVVKVLAVCCVLQGLPLVGQVPSFIYYMMYGGQPITIVDVMIWIAPQVIYLGTGVLLWLLSGSMARHLVATPAGETAELPAPSELLMAGCAIIGVLLIVWGIMDLGHVVIILYDTDIAMRFTRLGYPQTLEGGLIMGGLQLLLGLILFLRARGLALLWQKIRTGGVQETPTGM
jgi:hypothetical protein